MSKTIGQTLILENFDGYNRVFVEKIVAVDGMPLLNPFYIVSNMNSSDIKVYSYEKYHKVLATTVGEATQTSLDLGMQV